MLFTQLILDISKHCMQADMSRSNSIVVAASKQYKHCKQIAASNSIAHTDDIKALQS
jgi:hypothetical protein